MLKKKISAGLVLFSIIVLFLNFSKAKFIKTQKRYKPIFVLSSRWFHPAKSSDTLNTIQMIKIFNPSRIDWMYCDNKNDLNKLHQLNIPFSLTLNPQIPDSSGYTTKKTRIINYNGNPYIAPWMKTWKIKNPYWGCVNNTLFQKLFLKQGLKLASLGAYALMVDDAIFNTRLKSEKKVGCFCNYCIEGFKKFTANRNMALSNADIEQLKTAIGNNVNNNKLYSSKENILVILYEKYQQESVISFYKNWKKKIKQLYPSIKFLTNNYNGNWNTIYQKFDGGIAELQPKHINVKSLDSLYHLADSFNKTQVFSIATTNVVQQFKLMDYNAKNNRTTLLPWDVFIPNQSARYYMLTKILKNKIKELELKYTE